MKILVFIVISFAWCNAQYPISRRPCKIAFKCSLQDDPAWATDGEKCFVFRNACHLRNENCQRENRYERALAVISKDYCQATCSRMCPIARKTICGYYNEERIEFCNKCFMDHYSCKTGKTFMIYNEGSCEETPTPAIETTTTRFDLFY